MQEDNLLPSDGGYFAPSEPDDQKKERAKEKSETLQSLSVLKDIVARLDERIAFYGSIDSIEPDLKASAAQHQLLFNVNKIVKENLQQERTQLQALIDEHAK